MSVHIFDGRAFAGQREVALAQYIRKNRLRPRMASVVFREDAASVMYTKLKHQSAVRVGIEFSVEEMSITEPVEAITNRVKVFVRRNDVGGVMVQKPMKDTWEYYHHGRADQFAFWWHRVVDSIDPHQDVDCLTKYNLDRIYAKQWHILPATVKAVISILHESFIRYNLFGRAGSFDLQGLKVAVVGRSEIVGKPLAAVLGQYNADVKLYGSDLDLGFLYQADIVVSATGRPGVVGEHMVKPGVIVIDVGAPRGDVDELVRQKASVITPVPGGVGPVTVVSLLENLVDLMLEKNS